MYSIKFKKSKYKRLLLLKIFRKKTKRTRVLKYFLLFFITLGLFLVSNPLKIYADNFYSSAGDVYSCLFRQTYSLSIGKLPANQVSSSDLTFNNANIVGTVDPDFANKHTFTDFAYLATPRKYGVADRVSVPPNSKVDISLYYYNDAGHVVSPLQSYIFLSKPGSHSDITRLGAMGQEVSLGFSILGNWIARNGKAIVIGNSGSWAPVNPASPPTGMKVASFNTIQPLQVRSFTHNVRFSEQKLFVDFRLEVENISSYILHSVKIEAADYQAIRTYLPGDRIVYNYSQEYGTNYPYEFTIPSPKISDPNSHIECSATSGGSGINYDPNARAVLSLRSDIGAPAGWSAYQVDYQTNASSDHFCVTLIPYQIYGQETFISLSPNLDLTKSLSDNDETEVLEVNSHEGEVVKVKLQVSNSGARAENVYVEELLDLTNFEVLSICDGELNANGKVRWYIGDVHNDQTWSCEMVLRIKNNQPSGDYQVSSIANLCQEESEPCLKSLTGYINYEVPVYQPESTNPSEPQGNEVQNGNESSNGESSNSTKNANLDNSGVVKSVVDSIPEKERLAQSGTLNLTKILVPIVVIIAAITRFCYYKAATIMYLTGKLSKISQITIRKLFIINKSIYLLKCKTLTTPTDLL